MPRLAMADQRQAPAMNLCGGTRYDVVVVNERRKK